MSAKTAEVAQAKASAATTFSEKIIGIRVSPNNYFIALFLAVFLSSLLIYLENDFVGIFVFFAACITLPLLAWTDRITFDGKKLQRTGLLPQLWAKLNNTKNRLKISDVEQVETQALRALKRGGNVFYRYKTFISGKGRRIAFASGGEDYRQMIHAVFPLIPVNALDNRSIELRDYLSDPKEILMKAEFAKIPSSEVLESSLNKLKVADKKIQRANWKNKRLSGDELEKSDYLQHLGNELRLAGFFLQSLEAFRRALFLNPNDARLIFDFARCLHSYANTEQDERLTRRAFAALRLAERRASGNTEVLSRLGESYFQYGDWQRAASVFQKAISSENENFRAARGLAEIALREGKIAHVIHHFSTANRIAESTAIRRWTQNESEYFSRLNSDDEYMEMEVSRVNLLESMERSKKACMQIALLSFPAIVIGVVLDEKIMADIGWTISSLSLLIWTGILIGHNLFASRIPLDFENEE